MLRGPCKSSQYDSTNEYDLSEPCDTHHTAKAIALGNTSYKMRRLGNRR